MAPSKSPVPKLDLRRQYKELYLPSAKEVTFVDVPELLVIAVDGVVEAGSGRAIRRRFETRWRPCTAWATH